MHSTPPADDPLREAPIREGHLVATFLPQAWVGDTCVDCDAEGPNTWLVGWDEWDTWITNGSYDLSVADQDFLDHVTHGRRLGPQDFEDQFDKDDLDGLAVTARATPTWVVEWTGPFHVALDVRDTLDSSVMTDVNAWAVFPRNARADLATRRADLLARAILALRTPNATDVADLTALASIVSADTLPMLAEHQAASVRAAATARIVHAAAS